MTKDSSYAVAADELRQFVEQIEQLMVEKKEVADQISAVYAEAKARGYDGPALRAIIKLRGRNKDDIAEAEAILDLYKSALGMQ